MSTGVNFGCELCGVWSWPVLRPGWIHSQGQAHYTNQRLAVLKAAASISRGERNAAIGSIGTLGGQVGAAASGWRVRSSRGVRRQICFIASSQAMLRVVREKVAAVIGSGGARPRGVGLPASGSREPRLIPAWGWERLIPARLA